MWLLVANIFWSTLSSLPLRIQILIIDKMPNLTTNLRSYHQEATIWTKLSKASWEKMNRTPFVAFSIFLSLCDDRMQSFERNFLHQKKVLAIIDRGTKNCRQLGSKTVDRRDEKTAKTGTKNRRQMSLVDQKARQQKKWAAAAEHGWVCWLKHHFVLPPMLMWQSLKCDKIFNITQSRMALQDVISQI